MTPEDFWRKKSDEELVAASFGLSDFTDEGQRVIVAELERRRVSGKMGPAVIEEVLADTRVSVEEADAAPPHLGGLGRLWYGYVPLPRTYWAFGVAMNFLLLVAAGLAEVAGATILALLLALLGAVYGVFIVVAIWRSAGRYRGKVIWAHLARVSVAAGVARLVVTMLFGS